MGLKKIIYSLKLCCHSKVHFLFILPNEFIVTNNIQIFSSILSYVISRQQNKINNNIR